MFKKTWLVAGFKPTTCHPLYVICKPPTILQAVCASWGKRGKGKKAPTTDLHIFLSKKISTESKIDRQNLLKNAPFPYLAPHHLKVQALWLKKPPPESIIRFAHYNSILRKAGGKSGYYAEKNQNYSKL